MARAKATAATLEQVEQSILDRTLLTFYRPSDEEQNSYKRKQDRIKESGCPESMISYYLKKKFKGHA